MPPKNNKKKKRLDIKIDKTEWILPCEWAKCHEVFYDMEKFIQHMAKQHLNVEHGLVTPLSAHDSKDDTFMCQWRECGTRVVGEETDFFRHVFFHCFHVKIKCIGGLIIEKGKMQPCLLDTASRNLIPELPERLQCGWKLCEAVLDNPEVFYRHVDNHADNCPEGKKLEGGCVCEWEGCDLWCTNKYRLREHLRSHTQEKTIACPTCGGLFAARTKFIDHLKRQEETDLQVYQCSHCNKRYATERLLRDHVRHHVNQYKCPCCDMTCPTPSSLKAHLRYRHTNEKPYKCEHCDHSAKTLADLRKHMESHTVEAPFRCHIQKCSYTARSYTSLANHFKRQHQDLDVQKYACHVCKSTFTRGSKLTVHLKKRHKFRWPSGHSRFRYKLHEDGFWRLQTVRYESIQLTQQMENKDTSDASNDTPEQVDMETDSTQNASDLVTQTDMPHTDVDLQSGSVSNSSMPQCVPSEETNIELVTDIGGHVTQVIPSVNHRASRQDSEQSPSFSGQVIQPTISKHYSSHIVHTFSIQHTQSVNHVTLPLSEADCVINIPADERSLDKTSVVNVHCSDKGQENEINMAYNLEMLGDVALLIPNHPSDSCTQTTSETAHKKSDVRAQKCPSPQGYYVTVNAVDL